MEEDRQLEVWQLVEWAALPGLVGWGWECGGQVVGLPNWFVEHMRIELE